MKWQYLKVGTGYRFCQLIEKRFLDFGEFLRIHDLKDIFDLIQEHHLFGAVDFRPISKEAKNNLYYNQSCTESEWCDQGAYLFGQGRVFL